MSCALCQSSPDAGVVEAPAADADALPGLQEHHTHVVLVDAGKRGEKAFGTEAPRRGRMGRWIYTQYII